MLEATPTCYYSYFCDQPDICVDVPEETLPCWEVGALEECVFQDALHPSQGLDHVRPVVVQVPQLTIMTLMGPPERILFQYLQKHT